ncbi:hypothetical protein [Streptomyces sp. NEAU-S7GS2]|uniref:hypothetical protein n=1 Tax=unclassified Streptomyces TaxID=2593676 RepID=UPI00194EBA83|nr:hypothetical protein [Streptomyces sp. NEAU-S7GS2]
MADGLAAVTLAGYKLDGAPAAGDSSKRRRRALNTALEHAVVAGREVPENPLQRACRKRVGSNDWSTGASL